VAVLLLGMLRAGMPYWLAEMYWKEVRDCGRSHWCHAGPWEWRERAPVPESP